MASQKIIITEAQRGKAFANQLSKKINNFWKTHGVPPDNAMISGNSYLHLVAHCTTMKDPLGYGPQYLTEYMGVKLIISATNRITLGMDDTLKWAIRLHR